MIDIEIRGFQSIEHVKVRVEGFTALSGRSNIGKSSIVRAVKAALSGASGASFVRHGVSCARRLKGAKTCRCQASVHIKKEGFDLLWEKGDAINRYVFNGVELTVPGRGFPEFLKGSGFEPVRIGDDSRLIQVSDQLKPIFLLDESGATVANVLSDVARLDAINVAVKMVEKDRREANSLRKVREKDLAELNAQLDQYGGLDPALDRAAKVEARLGKLQAMEVEGARVYGFIVSLEAAKERVDSLSGVDAVRAPVVASLVARGDEYRKTVEYTDKWLTLMPPYKALQGVEKVEAPSPANLVRKAAEYQQLVSMQIREAECQATIAACIGVESVHAPTSLPNASAVTTLRQMGTWIAKLVAARVWKAEIQKGEQLPTLDSRPLVEKGRALTGCADLARKLDFLTRGVDLLEEQIRAAAKEAEEATVLLEEARAELRALGVCPTCAQTYQDQPQGKGHEHAVVHLPD
jgi:hypothetical protein